MKMCDFDYEQVMYYLFTQDNDEDTQRLLFSQKYVKLAAFNTVYELEICGIDKNTFYLKMLDDDENIIENNYSHHLSELQGQNEILIKENEKLKERVKQLQINIVKELQKYWEEQEND